MELNGRQISSTAAWWQAWPALMVNVAINIHTPNTQILPCPSPLIHILPAAQPPSGVHILLDYTGNARGDVKAPPVSSVQKTVAPTWNKNIFSAMQLMADYQQTEQALPDLGGFHGMPTCDLAQELTSWLSIQTKQLSKHPVNVTGFFFTIKWGTDKSDVLPFQQTSWHIAFVLRLTRIPATTEATVFLLSLQSIHSHSGHRKLSRKPAISQVQDVSFTCVIYIRFSWIFQVLNKKKGRGERETKRSVYYLFTYLV